MLHFLSKISGQLIECQAFNREIYEKSDADPVRISQPLNYIPFKFPTNCLQALIEDNVLRVVAEDAATRALLKSQTRSVKRAASRQVVPQQVLHIPANRPQKIHLDVLPLGFDLPPNLPKPAFVVPLPHNTPRENKRKRWENNHRKYLFQLLRKAMEYLNRLPKGGDFKAITEALHRHFQATDNPFPGRGYYTVHSYVTKKNSVAYPEFQRVVSEVFPPPQDATHDNIDPAILQQAVTRPEEASQQQPRKRKRAKQAGTNMSVTPQSAELQQTGNGDIGDGDIVTGITGNGGGTMGLASEMPSGAF